MTDLNPQNPAHFEKIVTCIASPSKEAVDAWITRVLQKSRHFVGAGGPSMLPAIQRFMLSCAEASPLLPEVSARRLSALRVLAQLSSDPSSRVAQEMAFRYPTVIADRLQAQTRDCRALATGASVRNFSGRQTKLVLEQVYGRQFADALTPRSTGPRSATDCMPVPDTNLGKNTSRVDATAPSATIELGDQNSTDIDSDFLAALAVFRQIARESRESTDTFAALMDAMNSGIGVAECVYRTIEATEEIDVGGECYNTNHAACIPILRAAQLLGPRFCHEIGDLELQAIRSGPFNKSSMYPHLFSAYALLRVGAGDTSPTSNSIAHTLARSVLALRACDTPPAITDTLLLQTRAHYREHRPDVAVEDIVIATLLLVDADRSVHNLPSDHPATRRLVQSSLPKVWLASRRESLASYLNRKDLPAHYSQDERSVILRRVANLQALGIVTTREEALTAAVPLNLEYLLLLERTGSRLRSFVRTEALSAQPLGTSEVIRYVGNSLRQFAADATEKQIEDEFSRSGNYPALAAEQLRAEMDTKGICALISSRAAESLVALEYFAAELAWKRASFQNFAVSLRDVADFRSTHLEFARIHRNDEHPATILVCVGYQGRSKHTGSGIKHIQTARAGDRAVKRLSTEGSDEAGFAKLLEDGILPALATSGCWMASPQQPTTHRLVTEKVASSTETFVSVIIAPASPHMHHTSTKPTLTTITAIVHPSGAKMRTYLMKQCAELVRPSDHETARENLVVLNSFIAKHSLTEILPEEIGLAPIAIVEDDLLETMLADGAEAVDGASLRGLDVGAMEVLSAAPTMVPPRTRPVTPQPVPGPPLPPLEDRLVFFPLVAEAILGDLE